MHLIAPISEDEVIAGWLSVEMASQRFADRIVQVVEAVGADMAIVREPDPSDDQENSTRRAILQRYRGYGTADQDLLAGFPTSGVTWERMWVDPSELLSVLYIDWDYWLKLSGGTRRSVDAAKNIVQGLVVYDVPNDGFFAIASDVKSGRRFPPIIAVRSTDDRSPLVVIEGHSRLTGYALAADHLPARTELILGIGEGIRDWWAY
jgi:hypothetical protein